MAADAIKNPGAWKCKGIITHIYNVSYDSTGVTQKFILLSKSN